MCMRADAHDGECKLLVIMATEDYSFFVMLRRGVVKLEPCGYFEVIARSNR